MRLSILVLLAAFASPTAFAAQPAAPKAAVAIADPTFSRGAPLPRWAQALAEIPPTQRTDPVVTRLAELQARVGATPSLLVNQAIQVNDPASLSEIGQFSLSYFPSYQKLLLHRVAIIRANQVMDRTASVNVRLLERETGVDAGVYGGEKSVQLLLDDVRAGDTLWITYTTEGGNPVFGKRWAQDFSWDRTTPVQLRRLTVLHPPGRPIYWRQLGDVKSDAIAPVIDSAGGMARMRFESRAIEAVQFEPSIPPNFLPVRRLQLSEYPDWQAVALWADGLFPRVTPSPGLKQLAARFAGEKTRLAQASAALHWVQDEIRYFSVSIGENSHRPQAPDTVLARRYGDCKDKSFLLVSLLSQLGISATPVLVNASAPTTPGKVMPSPTWFDHAIVRIELDGATYYVDPTRTGQKGLLNRLPAVLPGAAGLLAAADTRALLTLPEDTDQSPLLEYIENIGIASFDGDATLEARLVYRGAYAEWARRRFPAMAAAALKKELLSHYEKRYPGVTMVQAPKLADDAGGGRFEVAAHYKLPKPVTLEDGRYAIEYDSQIMDDTIGVPDKVVRNFPFRPPQGKFRGRYRLNLLWPALTRASDAPVMKSLDNPFFYVSEEYTLRGNLVSYMIDYRIKTDHVAPEAMPELSKQAKKLNPFASGRWLVTKANRAWADASGHSYRNYETVVDAQAIREMLEKVAKDKVTEGGVDAACELALRAVRVAEIVGPDTAAEVALLPAELAKMAEKPGVRRCLARVLFAEGQFTESIPQFQGLKDDDLLIPALAWARFHSGDGKGALGDMARYRAAREKAGELNGFDVAHSIALLQRLGEPVPSQLLAFGMDVADGPWPRPLVAMQAGVLTEDALVAMAAALPSDARELALGEAWFFIGQRRLGARDAAGAQSAFRWLLGNGIRGSREYPLAKHELAQLEPADADYVAGIAAEKRGDIAAALAKWRLAAARGLAAAQFRLAAASFDGRGTGQDDVEAMRWARLAAEQGHPAAMDMAGAFLLHGNRGGVPKDEAAAYKWHRRAAELGDAGALFNLAHYYLFGTAQVRRDDAQAVAYLRQSAELGNVQAQSTLAHMYTAGKGTAVDYTQAMFWADRASQHGNPAGHRQVAKLLQDGLGVAKDPERALVLNRLAADAGDIIAMDELQSRYEKGAGNATDAGRALAALEKSAAEGEPMAFTALGHAYRGGIGVPADPARAVRYWRKGAQLGERTSQQSLGMALHFGMGVEKDHAQAAEWYRKAADQGMEVARNNLADLYENGWGVPQDYARAVSLYRQAANAGLPMGFISLGSMYEHGSGVAANPQLAYTYFQLGIRARGSEKDADTSARLAKLAAQLDAAQRAEADAVAATWKPGSPFPGETAK